MFFIKINVSLGKEERAHCKYNINIMLTIILLITLFEMFPYLITKLILGFECWLLFFVSEHVL